MRQLRIGLLLGIVLLMLAGCQTLKNPSAASPTATVTKNPVNMQHATYVGCGTVSNAMPAAGNVTAAQAVAAAHQVMLYENQFKSTTAVSCPHPFELPYSKVVKFIGTGFNPPAEVWIVEFNGSITAPTIPSPGSTSSNTVPIKHIVVFVSDRQPYSILGTTYYPSNVPSVLAQG